MHGSVNFVRNVFSLQMKKATSYRMYFFFNEKESVFNKSCIREIKLHVTAKCIKLI